MASIAEVGFVDRRQGSAGGPARRLQVLYRLLRRTRRRMRWQMAMLRELQDPRLLSDIGASASADFRAVLALARAVGGPMEPRS